MPATPDVENFARLSEVLTGAAPLDRGLAALYLDRLRGAYPKEMADLLVAFAAILAAPDPDGHKFLVSDVKGQIVEERTKKFAVIVPQIITLWYAAEFTGPDGKLLGGTQEEFYGGLLWKTLHAQAPTHSTLQYGYWASHP